MAAEPSAARRLFLALMATLVGLLLVEGALSLFGGRSLGEIASPGSRELSLGRGAVFTDADLLLAAARNPGPYASHPDALVGITCRPSAELDVGGALVHTDALGMRVRPRDAQEAADEAADAVEPLDVVVLGDSVVFGWGVADDQTFAHALESWCAQVPGCPPIRARTVATPGWNHRNAVGFLLDHWDHYEPDLVLYMPVGNDLTDSYAVRETGHRREILDPTSHDPWLAVSIDRNQAFVMDQGRVLREQGVALTVEAVGPAILDADVTPESSRRLDANARSIDLLEQVCEARGARLALLQFEEIPYVWALQSRLAADGHPPAVIPLFADVPLEHCLPGDPHPTAGAQRTAALWTARWLFQRGWLPGESALPEAPDPDAVSLAAWRAPEREPGEWARLAADAREATRQRLLPVLDVRTGEGLFQLVGGLGEGAAARRKLMLVLAGGGDTLQLELQPLPGRPDLLPLDVDIALGGVALGALTLGAGDPQAQRVSLAVPAELQRDAPLELVLSAAREVVAPHAGRARMASYRFVRAALVDA